MLPRWEKKKKCLESAHVSWILSQGRIRVLLWTEDNFKRAGRNLLSATVKRQRKLVYVQRGVGTDRRPCPHGASRGHCLYRCFWLTEPRQLYTFMQIELRGQQAWISTVKHYQFDCVFFIFHYSNSWFFFY